MLTQKPRHLVSALLFILASRRISYNDVKRFYFTADASYVTTNVPTPESTKRRNVSVGTVVGIVAAMVFVIILILVIIWWRGWIGWRDTRARGSCLQRYFYCLIHMYLSREIKSYARLTHSTLFHPCLVVGRGNCNSLFILQIDHLVDHHYTTRK